MLTTYLSGLVGETISKLVSYKVQFPDAMGNVFGCVTSAGTKILPTFYEEAYYLALMLEDGEITSSVGDYVDTETPRQSMINAGIVAKNCGDETETSVVSALLAQMAGEKLEIVNV